MEWARCCSGEFAEVIPALLSLMRKDQSPLSEIPLFGRNVPYITTFGLFVILCVPLALVDNYPGLLVLRFLVGFMGSPCLATGGATMQDMVTKVHGTRDQNIC